MSNKSSIEWTAGDDGSEGATWNPVRGCVKVSQGCKKCYAETFAERWRGVNGHAYEQGFDPRLAPDKLSEPLKWKKPKRIFVNSMSDLFGEWVSDEYIAAVFGVMASAKQHTYQVLTKRAERLKKWHNWISTRETGPHALCVVEAISYPLEFDSPKGARNRLNCGAGWPWPLPNVWLGVSVENRAALPRLDHLRNVPAAVRFVSFEPLLEDLGTLDLTGVHWVIIGAESGAGRREMRTEWVRNIVEQATVQGCKVFFKQAFDGSKKVSLPMLDGRQWKEFPG